MKYKFEDKDPKDDIYLELGSSDNSLFVEFGSFNNIQFGGIMNIDFHDIDNMIKALQTIKDEITGEQSDTFKIITKN
ncbi:hypothetical protein [Tenacibaculum dicentrarchi]|uniref:hypothetical protein n=1 Tax=Tenacibaculum dicentrarchi TaxID=669041 RepID=UPI000C7B867E|nr:hypothetical protein TDCHD05_240002 [Tenacibaculum dicentrarchi]